MNESVLQSIKKLLGLTPDYTEFDEDIMLYINSALASLAQIGVGSPIGKRIHSAETIWADIYDTDGNFENVKTYVYLKVKRLFDPPANSRAFEALEAELKETEWRMSVQVHHNSEVIT